MRRFLASVAVASIAVAAVVAQVKPASDVPRFKVDPSWPTIPNNWQLGQVASVAPGVSATLSRASNQNDWQAWQMSMTTSRPR